MSRHRNIRAIDVDEEYEGYYSCYGHSVEEDLCISPQTASQFMYNRSNSKSSMSSSFESPDSIVEEMGEVEHNSFVKENNGFKLTDIEAAKLASCVEAIQNVVGDTISEDALKKIALESDFNIEIALNSILQDNAPKPPRVRKCPASNSNNSSLPESDTIKENSSHDFIGDNYKINEITGQQNHHDLEINNFSQAEGLTCDLKATTENILGKKEETNEYFEKENDLSTSEFKETGANELSIENYIPKKSAQDIVKIYTKERGNDKPLINLVVVGHVDAGKSTLMGHLLYKLGQVSQRTMHKFEQDSKKLGKSSFMYAWVLDETSEERHRGITMDVAESKFETPNRIVKLLDAPGHKDFIPNMITGAAQADVAILVVDATKGEFETGFETGGQTREHTMLIRSLGVVQIAVAINKMDNVDWSEDRYKSITSKMSTFLKQAGYKENDVTFIPCSGLTGENLTSPPHEEKLKCWYAGPMLVQVIDAFRPPERLISKPFRMCINDLFKAPSGGQCISGKIETGSIKIGDKVFVMPAGEQAIIKGISVDDISNDYAFAGDHVVIQLTGIDITKITCGGMICDIENPVKVTCHFEAQLVIFNVPTPITKGYPVILHYQSISEQAVIKKLISQLSRSTGEIIKKRPRYLNKNSNAIVEIGVNYPISIEVYKDFRDLGRFMLRSGGITIAAGIVTKVF